MNAAVSAPSIRDRLQGFPPRERAFLMGSGVAVAAFLAFMLLPHDTEVPVVLGRAPPLVSTPPAPPPAVAVEAPAEPTINLEGVLLRGVFGGGPGGGAALVLLPDGRERLVRVGADLVPGVRLRAVGVSHILGTSAVGEFRLELGKLGGVLRSDSEPNVGRLGPTPASSATNHRRATMQYQMGLEPRKTAGRVTGYTIRPGADLPLLQKGGLRPGDVLISINGEAIDGQERLTGIPSAVQDSPTVSIEFERNGNRMKSSVSSQ